MRESGIIHVFGKDINLPKQRILDELAHRFNNQNLPDVKQIERAKTESEKRIVELINRASNDALHDLGAENLDIPEQNIHVIKDKEWRERTQSSSLRSAVLLEDGAIMVREGPLSLFARDALRHMFQMKMFNAMQIPIGMPQGPKQQIAMFRNGLSVVSRDGSERRFLALNNALTEELTMRAFMVVMKDPVFAEERTQTKLLADNNALQVRQRHLREGVQQRPHKSPYTYEELSSPRTGLFFAEIGDAPANKQGKLDGVLDANGKFHENLSLAPGMNQLVITATNKFDKHTIITRQVLIPEKQIAGAQDNDTLTASVEDSNLDLEILVGPETAWMSVEVDSQIVFTGTMLPGSARRVSGQFVRLSTTNAGAVRVALNGQDLGVLGKDGETLRDVEFSK